MSYSLINWKNFENYFFAQNLPLGLIRVRACSTGSLHSRGFLLPCPPSQSAPVTLILGWLPCSASITYSALPQSASWLPLLPKDFAQVLSVSCQIFLITLLNVPGHLPLWHASCPLMLYVSLCHLSPRDFIYYTL